MKNKMNIPKRNLNFGAFPSDCAFLPPKEFMDNDGQPALSPMTELAVNFELSSMSTPRRKLSLSGSFNPTPERSNSLAESLESGIEAGSPLAECLDFDSPTLDNIRARKFSGPSSSCSNPSNLRRQLMTRRSFSSPVLQRKPLQPLNSLNFDDSPFTAVCHNNNVNVFLKPNAENVEENHSDLSICEMSDQFPDLEESGSFQIKKRKYVGRSLSAPTISPDSIEISDSGSSTSSCFSKGSDDDGFFDEISNDCPDYHMSSSAPTNFMGLIKAPIFCGQSEEEDKENCIPSQKDHNVFMKPIGVPIRSRSCSLPVKRHSPATSSSPYAKKKRSRQVYRSKSFYETHPAVCSIEKRLEVPTPRGGLQRSQSFDIKHTKSPCVDITSLFDMDDKNLIGDKSKQYSLPTIPSKHPDLKGIGPDTLSKLLDGKYKDAIGEFFIIDSRYPYEFDGGHIKDALNIFEKEDLVDKFLKNTPPTASKDKRQILIFHCEFSSKRGPAMCRFLRNKDRDIHQECYPQLFYPEMYILEGGYKEFYAQKEDYCEPKSYCEMLDPKYQQDLKLFSKRSKSWSEDKSQQRGRRTGLRY